MKNKGPPAEGAEGDAGVCKDEWACKNCTFMNAAGTKACEMCG